MLNGRHSVWMTHGPREQRRWRGICAVCVCQMRQPPAGRRPASGQCLKHHIQLLTCKRVLPCESMGVAGEARARVLRACRVRGGRVCWCASAEQARGRGGGEGRGRGEPGARAGLHRSVVAVTNFCDLVVVVDSELFQNIHNIKMRSTFVPRRPSFFVRHIRCSPPLPRVCVVACARRKPHHQNSLQCVLAIWPAQ